MCHGGAAEIAPCSPLLRGGLKCTRSVLNLALCVLALTTAVHAAGPVGPFDPTTVSVGTVDNDAGRCGQQRGMVFLSTYINGQELFDQQFDVPMGNVYFQGPTLKLSSVKGVRDQWCSNNNAARDIPSMTTGIVAWGTPRQNDVYAEMYYNVWKDSVDCGCKIKVYIRGRPTWATIATTSSMLKNQNSITLDGQCRSECSGLKIYETQKWCSRPAGNTADCDRGTFGANAFVYFDGQSATSGAASTGTDAFADAAMGPSSSSENDTNNNDSAPPSSPITSSASKTFPLPLFISMFALFGVVGNKRVLFLGILFVCVIGANAQGGPSGPRETLGRALGIIIESYYNSLGRCTSYMSEVLLSTGIDGKTLKFYFYQSPVGDAKFTGPKLELIGSRTYFDYGGYCGASAPSTIAPDSVGDVIIGDSYWGLASPEVSIYYKVYKPDGVTLSNCVLKLFMSDDGGGQERKAIYRLTKEGDCSDVPTLKINQLRVTCGTRGRIGGCIADAKNQITYFATGFNVYFDGQATSQAAAVGDFSNSTVAEPPSDGNGAAPLAPSGAGMPFGAIMATVGAITLSALVSLL